MSDIRSIRIFPSSMKNTAVDSVACEKNVTISKLLFPMVHGHMLCNVF